MLRKGSSSSLGLSVADLFCGAGGLSLGFGEAGFEIAYALDRDFDSCETYRENHPATKVEQMGIADRTPKAVARAIGEVDVVVGGPSCQGFSTHGRRNRWVAQDDERNKLWRHMRYVVKEVRPKAFLLENVPGLTYYKDGRISGEVVKLFESIGYQVHTRILLAADYGVPQLRRRVFVVGVLPEFEYQWPTQTHLGAWRRDAVEKWELERKRRGLLRHIPCWDALADLPRPSKDWTARMTYSKPIRSQYGELMRRKSNGLHHHVATCLPDEYRELMRHIPPGGTWRDIPPHLLPDRYRGMRRSDSTNLLGRLDPLRPAYTITTQFNNVTGGCFTHPSENRALTAREGARLQSFPDRYRFFGSGSSVYRQIGNAVPPLLAQHLAFSIAQSVSDRPARRPRLLRASPKTVKVEAPSQQTRSRMQRQARKNTGAELAIRTELFSRGYRYRVNERPLESLRREADVVFRRERVAVFVDGCFWHGCDIHKRDTKSNTVWWAEKIAVNRKRDQETNELLKAAGWRVVRIWEHEDPAKGASKVETAVNQRRARLDREARGRRSA